MSDKKWMCDHPVLGRPDYKSSAVPLRIFGDAVAVLGLAKSWGRSVECVTFSSYLNFGDTKLAHMIFTLLWKSKKTNLTMKKVWKILRWSLEALFKGRHPEKSYTGAEWPQGSWENSVANQPLASGYCGVVVACLPAA